MSFFCSEMTFDWSHKIPLAVTLVFLGASYLVTTAPPLFATVLPVNYKSPTNITKSLPITVIGKDFDSSECCPNSDYERNVRYDGVSHVWKWSGCGFNNTLRPDEMARKLANKTLLFLGDSTADNVRIVLENLLCNTPLLDRNGADMRRKTCATLTSERVLGLTEMNAEAAFDEDRKKSWKRVRACKAGMANACVLLPMRVARIQTVYGITVLKVLLVQECDWSYSSAAYALTWLQRNPDSVQFHVAVVSVGLHCSQKDFNVSTKGGIFAPTLDLAVRNTTFPLVWLELPDCAPQNKMTNRYRRLWNKTVNMCIFFGSSRAYSTTLSKRKGFVVSPTRFMTSGLRKIERGKISRANRLRNTSDCLYYDFAHPSPRGHCMHFMVDIHVRSVLRALDGGCLN